jgi:thiol-disulfide isomerase/thioredoxin
MSDNPSPRDNAASPAPSSGRPAPPVDRSLIQASCKFDTRQERLVDFRLVDIAGRPSRFREFDAEYILLDFWGTWCGPCLKTIPHLVELQQRFPADRLKVVGIAYEQGSLSERVAAVSAIRKRLGINYELLLGEADGAPCPLRNAFQVTAFPTLILVDRLGRVVWREQGASPTTLTRLDRVLTTRIGTDRTDHEVARVP